MSFCSISILNHGITRHSLALKSDKFRGSNFNCICGDYKITSLVLIVHKALKLAEIEMQLEWALRVYDTIRDKKDYRSKAGPNSLIVWLQTKKLEVS